MDKQEETASGASVTGIISSGGCMVYVIWTLLTREDIKRAPDLARGFSLTTSLYLFPPFLSFCGYEPGGERWGATGVYFEVLLIPIFLKTVLLLSFFSLLFCF